MNDRDPVQEWVDKYMVNPVIKQGVAERINTMIDPLTNFDKLADALLVIGNAYKGNDSLIYMAIMRLYEGYLVRRIGSPFHPSERT